MALRRGHGSGGRGFGPAAQILALLIAVLGSALPGEAAIRAKRSGIDTLGGDDALAGVKLACEVGGGRVWVSVDDQGECVAFDIAGKVAAGGPAVIYFEGDVPTSFRRHPRRLAGHLASLHAAMAALARDYRVPYIFIARPGTFGSTGNHANRRKTREYQIMNAAVEAVRARYRLGRLALAGQSGGATIVAALLTLGIADVACAAPSSGGFDLAAMLDAHAARQGGTALHREHPALLAGLYNVMDHVGAIKADPQRRILAIGDPKDLVTPIQQQRRFVEVLRAGGHRAEVLEGHGRGADHHGLGHVALGVAGLCLTGGSDQRIRELVGRWK